MQLTQFDFDTVNIVDTVDTVDIVDTVDTVDRDLKKKLGPLGSQNYSGIWKILKEIQDLKT